MHVPDEQAPEEALRQVDDAGASQQEAPPIFEFPASPPIPPILPSGSTPVQQGFVYPPPPSFYEQMASPPVPAPLPAARAGAQPSAPPPPAPFMPPTARKPRPRWFWVVIALVSSIVLVTCGLCSWGLYNIFSSTYQQVAGSIDVVNDYYTNLQASNYRAAYNDLAPQGKIRGLSEQQFTSQASQRDKTYGAINSFALAGQPGFTTNPDTGPDFTRFTMNVHVARGRLSYSVALSVARIGHSWKITDYSQL
jgi:hypothetical protein